MAIHYLSWLFYLVGGGLVILQWIGLVSFEVGLFGWILSLAGWGMGFLPGQRKKRISDEIAALDEQRQQGLITDEEFETLKSRLIDPEPETRV